MLDNYDDDLDTDSDDTDDDYAAPEATALGPLLAQGLITDVLGVVKSGKEATVYCCEAAPSTGVDLLAAKVYRTRHNRSFQNDAVYRQGRVILDRRMARAVANKSRFGRTVQFSSWLDHEFTTLTLLHAAGADVPRVWGRAESAVLLDYIGDRTTPALLLKEISPAPEEALRLFRRVMRNVETFLACHCIHGDLSPFNILYWRGRVTIIDFPQAVDPRANPQALELLQRDVANVCRYFTRFGVRADADQLTDSLWYRYRRAYL